MGETDRDTVLVENNEPINVGHLGKGLSYASHLLRAVSIERTQLYNVIKCFMVSYDLTEFKIGTVDDLFKSSDKFAINFQVDNDNKELTVQLIEMTEEIKND